MSDTNTTVYEADVCGYGEKDKGVITESLSYARMNVEGLSSKDPHEWEQEDGVWVCYNEDGWKLGYVYERQFGEVWERGYRD